MKIDALYIFIIAIIIVILAYIYVSSEYFYKTMLKQAFDKLNNGDIQQLNPEMNWNIINMEIDGYINNKKMVMNQPHRETMNSNSLDTFTDKNTLAAFLNNVVVFDIDSNEPLVLTGVAGMEDNPIQHYLPKTTVSAKTPHGYHYYFYNDTGAHIPCYVGLKINNTKYPIDLLTGRKQLIFLPPTRIESECYRWINSPFTHRIEPISKHMHLLDLFAYTKEFAVAPEQPNVCISKTIPNLLCIVWDFQIIYQLKHKCTSTTFEKLHYNQHELMYRTHSTYYLFLKHAPLKHNTAHNFVKHVADLIRKYDITGGIVHLGCGSSYKNNSIMQFNSCLVHNFKWHELLSDELRAEQTLVQTNVFTHHPISIISKDILHETYHNDTNDINNHVINEDMFLIIMLSNKMRIPCVCLIQVVASDESKDDVKYTKLIQYYLNNVLNATHHSSNPTQALTFFGEVPMMGSSLSANNDY